MTTRQQKVFDRLEGGARTWNELRELTKMSDDNLGFAIGELLDLRKIWTGQRGDVRVYGIERRTGLRSRLPDPILVRPNNNDISAVYENKSS